MTLFSPTNKDSHLLLKKILQFCDPIDDILPCRLVHSHWSTLIEREAIDLCPLSRLMPQSLIHMYHNRYRHLRTKNNNINTTTTTTAAVTSSPPSSSSSSIYTFYVYSRWVRQHSIHDLIRAVNDTKILLSQGDADDNKNNNNNKSNNKQACSKKTAPTAATTTTATTATATTATTTKKKKKNTTSTTTTTTNHTNKKQPKVIVPRFHFLVNQVKNDNKRHHLLNTRLQSLDEFERMRYWKVDWRMSFDCELLEWYHPNFVAVQFKRSNQFKFICLFQESEFMRDWQSLNVVYRIRGFAYFLRILPFADELAAFSDAQFVVQVTHAVTEIEAPRSIACDLTTSSNEKTSGKSVHERLGMLITDWKRQYLFNSEDLSDKLVRLEGTVTKNAEFGLYLRIGNLKLRIDKSMFTKLSFIEYKRRVPKFLLSSQDANYTLNRRKRKAIASLVKGDRIMITGYFTANDKIFAIDITPKTDSFKKIMEERIGTGERVRAIMNNPLTIVLFFVVIIIWQVLAMSLIKDKSKEK